jgi:hypothetical protein
MHTRSARVLFVLNFASRDGREPLVFESLPWTTNDLDDTFDLDDLLDWVFLVLDSCSSDLGRRLGL